MGNLSYIWRCNSDELRLSTFVPVLAFSGLRQERWCANLETAREQSY